MSTCIAATSGHDDGNWRRNFYGRAPVARKKILDHTSNDHSVTSHWREKEPSHLSRGHSAPAAKHGKNAEHIPGDHPAHAGEHDAHGEETRPETFIVLDLFSEALEASVAGVGVKITELKPKVQDVHKMYEKGEKHRALAKVLGVSTEIILVGFFIETFGIGETFIAALSFSGDWLLQLAQSTISILASSKVALLAGEKVEEAVEHKYAAAIRSESVAKPQTPHSDHSKRHFAHSDINEL